MQHNIRPATDHDFEAVHAWRTEAYLTYVERWEGGWDDDWQRQHLRDSWASRTRHIVMVDGQDIGVLDTVESPVELLLGNIVLAPGWRGKGVGTAVIRDVLRSARSRGLAVRLKVFKDNPAVRLYQRLGFRVDTHADSAASAQLKMSWR